MKVPAVRRVGLLGGGVIGAGWAARFLLHGVDVRLFDPQPDAHRIVEAAVADARRAYGALFTAALPVEGELDVVATVDDAVDGVDFVQESAPERLELKRSVLGRADAVADPRVVIASSTSGLRPSALREGMAHPHRLVVGHPFNPVYLLPLVEVCGGDPAAGTAVERATEIYRSVGMFPLVLGTETDGFVADRLMEALWREALWLVHDGVATTGQIDDAVRYGAGLRWSAMGTFLTYRLAGGEAGMRHFLAQFGPALQWPWTKLTDVPALDDALIDRVVDQSDAQAAGMSIRELTTRRDDCLVAVLQGLQAVGWGAGQVVTDHDRALAARSTAHRHVDVVFPGGHRGAFHHLWLRDNCPCPACLHPQTRERVLDTFTLDPDVAPVTADQTAGELNIEWSDGHRSTYGLGWLRDRCPCAACHRPARPPQQTWDATIAADLPEVAYASVVADDAGLATFVETLWTTGFVFVRDVPRDGAALHDLARHVGSVRETNFGSDFQVRTMLDPNNVAYTSVELHPHSDLANYETPPGVQFLLCVDADAPGGDSTLVDGFAVADRLRAEAPDAFALLRDLAIPYRFHDATHDLRWSAPVIGLGHDGSYNEVRFHNALRAPFDLPLDMVEPIYAALRRFHALATSDELRISVRLQPGDLMVFHNRRVLHGRTAFDPGGGQRHLIGLYVDVDDWLSRGRVLSRSA
ncbi:MAG: TauD/TfdA family dioxygenase [Ilumatobacteraceae bacterium]